MANIDWKNKKVLITGGTGFVGSHLTKRMLSYGADLALFVLDEESQIPSGVTIFRGNLQDAPDVERAIGRFQPNFIFHLGAQPLVGTAMVSVYDTLDTNIRGSINLLQAVSTFGKGVEGVVFVTTDKVYGEFSGSVDESAPLLGIGNPYDTSKVCADYLAQMFAKVFKLPISIIRSGNIYGAGDKNFDRLIPGTFRRVLNNLHPIIRSDGKFTRDYIFIDDILDGYIMMAELLPTSPHLWGKPINFGSLDCYTVLEVVDEILKVTGNIHLVPEIQNIANNEIPHQHLNWEFAKKLGWRPKIGLADGIQKSLEYYKGYKQ